MSIRHALLCALTTTFVSTTAFSEAVSTDTIDSIAPFVEAFIEGGKVHEACELLDRLEHQYLPEALFLKGIAYLTGVYDKGVRNPRQASVYFAKAAALKYSPAIAALADSYLDGDGTEKNEEEAFRLYKKAADVGEGSAQFNVAILYRDGIGTKKSPHLALTYMRKAAKNKDLVEIREEAEEIISEIIDEIKHK